MFCFVVQNRKAVRFLIVIHPSTLLSYRSVPTDNPIFSHHSYRLTDRVILFLSSPLSPLLNPYRLHSLLYEPVACLCTILVKHPILWLFCSLKFSPSLTTSASGHITHTNLCHILVPLYVPSLFPVPISVPVSSRWHPVLFCFPSDLHLFPILSPPGPLFISVYFSFPCSPIPLPSPPLLILTC